jgi:hypothetical protein
MVTVKKHVVISAPFADALMDKLAAVSSELLIERVTLPDGRWPENKTTNAEIFYMVNQGPRPEQAPQLRWVQGHWAGCG